MKTHSSSLEQGHKQLEAEFKLRKDIEMRAQQLAQQLDSKSREYESIECKLKRLEEEAVYNSVKQQQELQLLESKLQSVNKFVNDLNIMHKYKLSSDGQELSSLKVVEKVIGYDNILRALSDKSKLVAN